MNYITILNEFWRFYDANSDSINTSDIVLYNVLLRYCNKIGWVNDFFIDPFLMAAINPLSPNTYYKSLDNLEKVGLIKYKKGKYNVSKAKITILNFKTSANNSIENSIKFSVNTSTNNSIGTINKTIIQLNNNTIKQLKEKDFDFILKSKEFKKYLEKKNLDCNIEEKGIKSIKDNSFSDEIISLFDNLIDYFPNHYLQNQDSIKSTLDKLIRIDNYTASQIIKICKHFRADDFWAKNFQTPNKLRQKNKDGIKYIDYFNEALKDSKTSFFSVYQEYEYELKNTEDKVYHKFIEFSKKDLSKWNRLMSFQNCITYDIFKENIKPVIVKDSVKFTKKYNQLFVSHGNHITFESLMQNFTTQ